MKTLNVLHFLRRFAAVLLPALVAACGGGGDGPSGTAPTISNLTVSPQAAYNTTDPLYFSSQFDFFDPDANVSTLTLRVRDESDGSVVDLGTDPIAGIAGMASGTVLGQFIASGVAPGTYTVLINVTDSTSQVSNVLGAPVRIAAYPWTSRLAGPTPREYAAAAVLDGKVYVAGGQLTNTTTTPGPATDLLEIYDPAANTWSAGPPMPTARMGLTLTAYNGKLYAIGGRTDGFTTSAVGTVAEYNPGTGLWTARNSMPTPRFHAAAAPASTPYGDLIVVAGGEFEVSVLDTVQGYNPITNAWVTLAPMPSARGRLALGSVGGRLYAVGGYAGTLAQWVGTVEEYDPQLGSWATKTPMPTPRAHLALAVINGQLLAAGGENVNRSLDVLESYDPVLNGWRSKTPSTTAFTRAAGAVVNDRMQVFGNTLTLQYDPSNEIR
jgi:N-acetylneuraminic acid mutarotase